MDRIRIMPEPGDVYLHFKGNKYVVLHIAEHTETGEKFVIYRRLMGTNHTIYARPLDMFLSEVDHKKYPDVKLKYRFNLMGGKPADTKNDVPSHYDGDVQPIELMEAQMSTEKFLGFLLGNIIKYASRFGKNGKAMSDAKKIRQYAEWLVQMTEHGEIEVVSHEKNESAREAQA